MPSARVHAVVRRLKSPGGVVAMQAVNSLTTVVQLALFAMVLPRSVFDDYSVWITSGMFAVGLGQAIGSERVVIGRRSFENGMSSAWALALVIGVVQLGMAALLSSPVLAICATGSFLWALWDYLRIVWGFDRAGLFLRADGTVVALQIAGVLAATGLGVPGEWRLLGWWGVGALAWGGFIVRFGLARRAARRGGWSVLWRDRRECAPLLLDAALAGVPLVLAFALANAQGPEGTASEARMALTLLGPLTVLGIAGRRIVYAARARGGFDARTRALFAGAILFVFVVCFATLTVTRTPLYPLIFPGFAALAWWAIGGFAVNHSAVMAAMLPAANLRAEAKTLRVGLARIVATVTAVGYVLVLGPIDSVAHTIWCVAASSIVYALLLQLASARLQNGIVARPSASTADARG